MFLLGIAALAAIVIFVALLCVVSAGFRTFVAEVLGTIRDYIEIAWLEVRVRTAGANPALTTALTSAHAGLARVGARVKLVAVTCIVVGILGPIVLAGFLLKGGTTSYIVITFLTITVFLIWNGIRTSTIVQFAVDFARGRGLGTAPVGTPVPTAGTMGLIAIFMAFIGVVAIRGYMGGNFSRELLAWTLAGSTIWIIGILKRRKTLAPQFILMALTVAVVAFPSAKDALAENFPTQYRYAASIIEVMDTKLNGTASTNESEASNVKAKVILPAQVYGGTPANGKLANTRLKVKVKNGKEEKEVNEVLKVGTFVQRIDPKSKTSFVLLDENGDDTPVKVVKVYRLDENGEITGTPVFIDTLKLENVVAITTNAVTTPQTQESKTTTAPAAAQTAQQSAAPAAQPAASVSSNGNCPAPNWNGNVLTFPACFAGEYDLGPDVAEISAIDGTINFGGPTAIATAAGGSSYMGQSNDRAAGIPLGVIVARIEGRNWVRVKPGIKFSTGGKNLIVGINDSNFADNTGSYTLRVVKK